VDRRSRLRRKQSRDPIVLRSIATDDDLEPRPIHPEWLLDGSPQTRARSLPFTDTASLFGTIWETTAGRFEWHYAGDELVAILEGEVEITPPTGEPFTLRRGDVVFFPGGQIMHWRVPVYVKKLAIDAVGPSARLRRLAARIPLARRVFKRIGAIREHA
jgi:uncharacterized cupin superfamily protein